MNLDKLVEELLNNAKENGYTFSDPEVACQDMCDCTDLLENYSYDKVFASVKKYYNTGT